MRPLRPFLLLALLPSVGLAQADALPRRPWFGAALVTAPDSSGVVLQAVTPGSPAAEAGLRAGDRMVLFGGEPVGTASAFLTALRSAGAGAVRNLAIDRGGTTLTLRLVLRELPRESGDGFEVRYASVLVDGARRRTILTRPAGRGPYPAVLLLGGIGCYPVDNPLGPADPYATILRGLTRRGFVTLRVEKSGMGDSEGAPCSQVDFETELAGYLAALRRLETMPEVNPDQVFLLGHSIGGLSAPLIARQVPVRGVIVIATTVGPWLDYEVENSRRQLSLAGLSGAALAEAVTTKERCTRELLLERKPLSRLLQETPGCRNSLLYPAHERYMQQLAALDLRSVWTGVDAAVLALWPASDFVTAWHDHEEIAALVNRSHPGRAVALTIPATDHYFRRMATPAQSFANPVTGGVMEPFNDAVVELVGRWLDSRIQTPSVAVEGCQ